VEKSAFYGEKRKLTVRKRTGDSANIQKSKHTKNTGQNGAVLLVAEKKERVVNACCLFCYLCGN